VIGDADLRIIWQAAESTPYPFGPLIRMLILSGQRLNEIARAKSSEIDADTGCLVIPAARMKNKQVHAVPLTEQSRQLLDRLPRYAEGDCLFSTTFGKKPIAAFSKYKRRLDKAIVAIGCVEPWQLHDLRRTVRTGLSRAGISVFEAELVIAHTQSGVHGVYDRHRYDDEKRAALEKWEQLLARIRNPPANLIELRKAQ
jgi:integrase